MQPLARKHLGAPVVRIETMSSYSCRNAYGRAHGRLSEHGKANALDIGSFVTARGQAAMVVADWGPTARQIAAQAAAAKAGESHERKTQAGAGRRPKTSRTWPPRAASRGQRPQRSPRRPAAGHDDRHPGVIDPGCRAARRPDRPPQLRPGARRAASAVPSRRLTRRRPSVLTARRISCAPRTSSACKLFNTVLGPEANNAHHNHFHVDMAERIKNTKICE